MNKQISRDCISVVDAPLESLCGTCSDDGVVKKEQFIIRDGVLCGLLSDTFYSSLYGCVDTGNGRTERYDRLPIPRMHNTYLMNGASNPNDMAAAIKYGVVVNDIQGGSCDFSSGSFSFNIAHAYIIRNGEYVAQLRPFTIIANTLSFLNALVDVGNDLSFYGSVCGKKGQMLRVSYGAPTMMINKEMLGGAFGG